VTRHEMSQRDAHSEHQVTVEMVQYLPVHAKVLLFRLSDSTPVDESGISLGFWINDCLPMYRCIDHR
jgi:hypothetical protein